MSKRRERSEADDNHIRIQLLRQASWTIVGRTGSNWQLRHERYPGAITSPSLEAAAGRAMREMNYLLEARAAGQPPAPSSAAPACPLPDALVKVLMVLAIFPFVLRTGMDIVYAIWMRKKEN